MRKWPFTRIAELLASRYQLKITGRAISDFCQRRGIKKGIGETAALKIAPNHNPIADRPLEKVNAQSTTAMANLLPKLKKKKMFDPRDGPVGTRTNGELDVDL